MKKILTVCLLVFALFVMGCGSDSKKDDNKDSGETAADEDVVDTEENDAEPAESGSEDSGENSDKPDTAETSDSTDSADPADSGTTDPTDSGSETSDSGSSETSDSGDSQSDTGNGDSATQIVKVECTGSEKICRNNADFIGEILTCNGTKFEKTDDCEGTSCDGNKCGECVNYTRKCINSEDVASEDFRKGSVYICKEGKWGVRYSCDKSCDTGKIDGGDCGECMEGDYKCEMGNVPKDTVLKKLASGEILTVPEGFITGLRSKCVEGKWVKLELDDPENCFVGHLTESELIANGYAVNVGSRKNVITVYNYDTTPHPRNKYGLTMCKDDVECGKCSYTFSLCSGNRYATCYKGEVLDEYCSYTSGNNAMCATGNSCYPYSTIAYCQGSSCQNCKSICDWYSN